ncbi:MSC_0882 family membrane protein [Mycoplasma sp. ATU-Cv-703]|uniref:MSC_0882 family membrane protein n=1 Tax=Mycoplasma sp. ATU-Cv-703 TaxID=2498595 RepID=UPI000FDDE36F
MELKPLFQTSTIKIVTSPATSVKKSLGRRAKVSEDPLGVIPTGIFRVIRSEILRQKLTLIFLSGLLLALGIWITLFALVYKTSWISYVLPSSLLLFSVYKFLITLVEMGCMSRAVTRYREDLRLDLTSTPPFLATLYLNLFKKQIAHNWLTFVMIFYGGILTLLLWWLKDFQWWFFDFKNWIQALFANPTLMSWIFTIALITLAVLHILMSIHRRKKILEIDAYFGAKLAPASEIETLKTNHNKFYRRLFLVSLLVMLIIPVIIKMVVFTILRRRRK